VGTFPSSLSPALRNREVGRGPDTRDLTGAVIQQAGRQFTYGLLVITGWSADRQRDEEEVRLPSGQPQKG
jgi:hypothetical protein